MQVVTERAPVTGTLVVQLERTQERALGDGVAVLMLLLFWIALCLIFIGAMLVKISHHLAVLAGERGRSLR